MGKSWNNLSGCPGLIFCYITHIHHPLEHTLSALQSTIQVPEGIVPGGRLGQPGQQSRFIQGEIRCRLIKKNPRSPLHPLGTRPEIDLIYIGMEDLLLSGC